MTCVFGSRGDRNTVVVLLGVLAVLPLFLVQRGLTYRASLLVVFLVFAIFTLALNIVFAHTDQLFLFVGALAGVSTYTTALLADVVGVTAWLTLPVGVLAAGTVGFLVSYVSAHRGMSVIVIAILTLSLQFAASQFFVGAREITNGSTGFRFTGLQVPVLSETIGLSHELSSYYVLLVTLAGTLVLYSWLLRSRFGLAFDALRQDDAGAESVGVDVIRYKSIAGFTSAAIIGLAGPLFASAERFVLPSMFSFQGVDVLVLIMLILGGMRTILGPVVGAGLVVVLNELLQEFGQWRTVAYGLLLTVLFLYFSEGIVPKVRTLLGRDGDSHSRARSG